MSDSFKEAGKYHLLLSSPSTTYDYKQFYAIRMPILIHDDKIQAGSPMLH